jgi:hypothetical protein
MTNRTIVPRRRYHPYSDGRSSTPLFTTPKGFCWRLVLVTSLAMIAITIDIVAVMIVQAKRLWSAYEGSTTPCLVY